jgi:Protein of unknown function (DUF3429)
MASIRYDVPRTALMLGVAGLAPFIAGAAGAFALIAGWRHFAVTAVMTYGAVVLSFLGGVHWGAAMRGAPAPNETALVWGVMPALVGWSALFAGPMWGLPGLIVGFAAAYYVDDRACRRGALPMWYLSLRMALTVAVIASLAATWLAQR